MARLRLRKSTWELAAELEVRLHRLLSGRAKEFGRLTPELEGQLARLLAELRETRYQLVKQALADENISPRSSQLAEILYILDRMKAEGVEVPA